MNRRAWGLAFALVCTPLWGQGESSYLYCVGMTKVSGATRSFISQVFQVSGVDLLKDGTAGRTLVEVEKAWSDFTGCDFKGDHAHCYCTYSASSESATRLRTGDVKQMEDALLESSSGQMNPSAVRSVELPSDSINAAVAKARAAR